MFRLKKTSVPALMLAAVLLFATAAGAEEADPAAVRVGEVCTPFPLPSLQWIPMRILRRSTMKN